MAVIARFLGLFLTMILKKFVGMAAWLGGLVVLMFSSFYLLGTDVGAWVVEQLLDIVIYLLNLASFDLSIFNWLPYLNALPPVATDFMRYFGFDYCVSLVLAAIPIRLLIGFVHKG